MLYLWLQLSAHLRDAQCGIEMKGTFRFHEEFGVAVDLINRRRVDLSPLLSGIYPLNDAVAAFEAAGDRSKSMKIQLAF
jgi:L-idonate 5-dehydrogenase